MVWSEEEVDKHEETKRQYAAQEDMSTEIFPSSQNILWKKSTKEYNKDRWRAVARQGIPTISLN